MPLLVIWIVQSSEQVNLCIYSCTCYMQPGLLFSLLTATPWTLYVRLSPHVPNVLLALKKSL